jgi:RNA-directed DNA polymerase
MSAIGLGLNETKTCVRDGRREQFDFLGYTFGADRSRKTGRLHLAAKPSRKAVRRLKQKVWAQLRPGNMDPLPSVVRDLNRLLSGWANYFSYGATSTPYRSIDAHVFDRMHNFLRRRHKLSTRGIREFGWDHVYATLGVTHLYTRHRGRTAVSLA